MFRVTQVEHLCGETDPGVFRNYLKGRVGEGGMIGWTLDGSILGKDFFRCPFCPDIHPLPLSLDSLLAIIADEKGEGG